MKIGTLVKYWKGERSGGPSGIARTRSEVQDIPSMKDVVWLEGVAGCIAMSHIEVIDDIDKIANELHEQICTKIEEGIKSYLDIPANEREKLAVNKVIRLKEQLGEAVLCIKYWVENCPECDGIGDWTSPYVPNKKFHCNTCESSRSFINKLKQYTIV